MVIPQILEDHPLPPLILKKDEKSKHYTQFMGGDINIDNKNENFILRKTFLTGNVPRIALTTSVQLDVIGVRNDFTNGEVIRFNIFEITLINEDANGNLKELAKISIDLTFMKMGEENPINTSLGPVFFGEVKLIVNSTIDGVTTTHTSNPFNFRFNSTDLSEIQCQESEPYLGSCTNCDNFILAMSPQTLLFSVIF
jgi:hypothetical protein